MSKLARVLALGALLAATNLAAMTAIAHAQAADAFTAKQAARRPPTQTQVGESWYQRPPTTNQSAVAGDTRRPPHRRPGRPALASPGAPADSSGRAERPTQVAGRVACCADRRAGAGWRACRQASKLASPTSTDRLTPPRSASRWAAAPTRQPHHPACSHSIARNCGDWPLH
jgi:hypothetical protein